MSNQMIARSVSEPVSRGRKLAMQMLSSLPLIEEEVLRTFGSGNLSSLMKEHQRELAGLLNQAVDDLEAAERSRVLEAGDDEAPRQRRDKAAAKLYEAAIDTRAYLVSGFGEGADTSYGLAGTLPQTPKRLLVLSKNAIDHLTERPAQNMNRFGVDADTARAISELQPLQEELEAALNVMGIEDLEYKNAQTKRNQALVHLQRTLSGTSRMYIGMLTLIERQDLIQAAQSITKRSRRRVEEASVETTPAEAAPAETSEGEGE